MPVGVVGHRGARAALGVAGAVVLLLVLAQLLLPALAAKRVGDRVRRYGTVRSVSVSAWPALELLWGRAGSVSVGAGTLALAPDQIAALLWEARDVDDMTVTADAVSLRVPALAHELTLGGVRMDRHGAEIQASATLTQ
ncbi:MAG TPA: hypothetical protein VFV03_01965, partial [Solirubrobacteraceae bacterium]|nr:hypothetical protein [Solirubrobacteraceae bacterium]